MEEEWDWKPFDTDKAYEHAFGARQNYNNKHYRYYRCSFCHKPLKDDGSADPCPNKTCQVRAALLGKSWS